MPARAGAPPAPEAPRALLPRRAPGWALIIAGMALLALLPPVRARAKAVPTMAEALGAGWPRPLAGAVEQRALDLGGVAGDLYLVEPAGPGIVLLPGATPAGLRDARVQRLATALARSDRTVWVPDLHLYERRFETADFDRIRGSVRGLAERTGGPVSLLGFSYGGGLALVSAADAGTAALLEQVVVFGAYFDLVGVIQAASTGRSIVGDREVRWDGDPAASRLLAQAIVALAPAQQRDALTRALETADPEALSDDARPFYDLATHRDPRDTEAILQRLPPLTRTLLQAFSPSAVADRIEVPVSALHSVDDPAVPYAELQRLERALPHARTTSVALFGHVDLARGRGLVPALPDLLRLWHFGSGLLGPQEATVPAFLRRLVW